MSTSAQPSLTDYQQRQCLQNQKIFIVDDDILNLRLFQVLFESLGAAVRTAQSVQDAISGILDETPDLLISDICLPEQTGIELIQWLRSLPTSQKTIPAIAISGDARTETRHECLDTGYQQFLCKPAPFQKLVKESYLLLTSN